MSRPVLLRVLGALALAAVVGLACSEPEPPPLPPADRSWASDTLLGVTVLDARTALMVGVSGTIYRTEDAAQTWHRVHVGASTPLHDLTMGSESIGWAVGAGQILVTRDGGRSWRPRSLPESVRDASLHAVAATGPDDAVAVGASGVSLITEDAGETWSEPSAAAVAPSDTDPIDLDALRDHAPRRVPEATAHDVLCLPAPRARCIRLGERGATAYSNGAQGRWVAAWLEGPLEFEPIVMGEGRFDLSRASVERIGSLAEMLRGQAGFGIRVEGIASEREIERLGRQRGPESLFEILEARSEDVRTALEEAGLASERIQLRGAPPWDYEETLDDDPERVERYFAERRGAQPGVRVVVLEERTMRAGLFLPEEAGAGRDLDGVAVGDGGAVWLSNDGGLSWRPREAVIADHDLHAVAAGANGLFAVGEQGVLRRSLDRGRSWQALEAELSPVVFEAFHDIEFAPEGGLALIVGGGGRVLRSRDGGAHWERAGQASP